MLGSAVQRAALAALLLDLAMAAGCVSASAHRPSHPIAVPTGSEVGPPVPTVAPVRAVLAPPVRLLIPSLNVDAKVESLGVDATGAMDTPHNIWDVGWYRLGPSPGAPGDAVIDGHVGLPGSPLVFARLGKLAIGASIIAVLADGTRSRFSVIGIQSWPAAARPPGLFSGEGEPRLSLITCTGSYNGSSQTYANRLVVEAGYVGPA